MTRFKGFHVIVLLAGVSVIYIFFSLCTSHVIGRAQFVEEQRKTSTTESIGDIQAIMISYNWTHHPFWKHGMEDFCDLVKQEKARLRNTYSSKQRKPRIVVDFSTRCHDPYHVFGLGVGNIVMAVYGLRLTAVALGVDFSFRCLDVTENDVLAYTDEVLPWLEGYFEAPSRKGGKLRNGATFSPFVPTIPGVGKTCRGFLTHPLHYMSEAMRHELRIMALTLLGPRTRAQQELAQQQNILTDPLIPDTEVDNVAIHLRCGDVIGVKSADYGFVRFDTFRDLISPSALSIGIITQPFEKEQNRQRDQFYIEPCRGIVESLVQYLQQYFPHATISVRNGPQETAATAFARLVLANQTFSSLSTFSLFPAIASFGTSYVQNGRLAYFVPPIAEVHQDVTIMNGTVLTPTMLRETKTLSDVIAWLQNGELELRRNENMDTTRLRR